MANATILKSVGEGGDNSPVDVMVVQALLNQIPDWRGGPTKPLLVTGLCGYDTKTAIGLFQDHWFEWSDGRVDPGGVTLAFLNLKARPLWASLPFLPTQPTYVPQVLDNRCWAAIGTMMFNWRNGTRMTTDEFAALRFNPYYRDVYDLNKVLPVSRQPEYLTSTLKMKGRTFADFEGIGVEGWLDAMKAFKVMVVQHKVVDGGLNYLHARILCGMTGLGSKSDTSVRIIDPWWSGTVPTTYPTYHAKMVPFWQFEEEFERPTGNASVLQVWHY